MPSKTAKIPQSTIRMRLSALKQITLTFPLPQTDRWNRRAWPLADPHFQLQIVEKLSEDGMGVVHVAHPRVTRCLLEKLASNC